MPRSTSYVLLFHLLLCCILSGHVNAQFAYAGADVRFSWCGLGSKSKITRTVLDISAEWRPIRNLGVGFLLPVTMSEKADVKLTGEEVWRYAYGRLALYKPTIKNEVSLKEEFGAYLRLYLDTRTNVFLDVRMRSFFIQQELVLSRPYHAAEYSSGDVMYAAIPAQYWSFSKGVRAIAPGFSLGWAPHVGKNGFILLAADVDLLNIDIPQSSLLIESDYVFYEDRHKYTLLWNSLSGSSTVWSVRFGGGVRF